MSQYSFSYNYDSLYDAFNTVNRKGKMQKRYLSPEYLAKAQEYREMRKNLNKIGSVVILGGLIFANSPLCIHIS